jgi:hypothetical protein
MQLESAFRIDEKVFHGVRRLWIMYGPDRTKGHSMLKSAAVVVGSYLLSILLVLGTDPLLSRLFPGDFVSGRVPSNIALLASTAAFIIVSILCAWVCAHFAPGNAAKHVLWFFLLGELMGIAAIIPNWSKGWPHWYWLSWLMSWPVSCWIGLQIASHGQSRQSRAAS